jgi:phi LC3 family holin
MNKINWLVRLKNKSFWVVAIPSVLLIISLVLDIFGVQFDVGPLQDKLLKILDAVFAIIAALGIVTDFTTVGFKDPKSVMTYTEPRDESVTKVMVVQQTENEEKKEEEAK